MSFAREIRRLEERLNRIRDPSWSYAPNRESAEHGDLDRNIEELASSLEELRVAEQEIEEKNRRIEDVQREIEAERRRYQDLFSRAPDAYLISDEHGRLVEANRVAHELFGAHRLKNVPLA